MQPAALLPAVQQLSHTLLEIVAQREDLYAARAALAALSLLDLEHTAQIAPTALAAIGAAVHRATAAAASEDYLVALFGSLKVLLERVASGDLASIMRVEGVLSPAIKALCEDVGANDMLGMNHHLYSTLSVLLQLRGESSNLPGEYREVLLSALRPAAWEYSTHVPALVDLLRCYFEMVPADMCKHEVVLLVTDCSWITGCAQGSPKRVAAGPVAAGQFCK